MNLPASPVGLISNPGSGHNRDQFERIQARIAGQPGIHHRITHSEADIAPALAELAALDIGVLAINGGDGTVSAVLGELLESKVFDRPPLIALLPGGTANMNAGDIGVRGSLRKAVNRFCQWCESERDTTGKLARRALMRVVTDSTEQARYCMFLGGGAVIHGTEYAHREIHSRGLRDDFSLALGTVRTVWGVLRNDPAFNRHVDITLTLDDGEPAQYDTLILAVSTLQRLSFGMRPFWSQQPGAIRLTLMEQGCTRFARTFFSIVRGHPNRNAIPQSGYRSYNADRLRLAMSGKINLDGELVEVGESAQISASEPLEFLRL
ncbi:lipid kinase YegS [Halioglobus japonicus]|nr:lipid kinase YegS [Halioglobus japonicus]